MMTGIEMQESHILAHTHIRSSHYLLLLFEICAKKQNLHPLKFVQAVHLCCFGDKFFLVEPKISHGRTTSRRWSGAFVFIAPSHARLWKCKCRLGIEKWTESCLPFY